MAYFVGKKAKPSIGKGSQEAWDRGSDQIKATLEKVNAILDTASQETKDAIKAWEASGSDQAFLMSDWQVAPIFSKAKK